METVLTDENFDSEVLASELPVIVDMRQMHIAPTVVLFTTAITQLARLLPTKVFVRRIEVPCFMLGSGQHVGNLPRIFDAMFQRCLDDEVHRFIATDSKALIAAPISIAHDFILYQK